VSTAATTAVRASASGRRTSAIRWINLDALMSGSSGVLLAAAAPLLDGLLGVPVAFLVPLGLLLFSYAAALVLLVRAGAPVAGVKAVVAANTLWVVASVTAVLADVLTLTTTGTVIALLQAAAVALLAALQLRSFRL
jgi:hypothetical protein